MVSAKIFKGRFEPPCAIEGGTQGNIQLRFARLHAVARLGYLLFVLCLCSACAVHMPMPMSHLLLFVFAQKG